ncbi:MAG: DUF2314 domain-containing protein [Gemmatimonadetes bacterium]|nr:DUF2314 domain-containing protein [Gemmatimonadota bacterium]
MAAAHSRAAATTQHFAAHVARAGEHVRGAKLRFRDPDLSDELGEDCFVFLWLTTVTYHPDEQLFSGVFFEVPRELRKWHEIGDRLSFEAEDIFDWMILEQGTLHGGFTLRVARQRLAELERADYDRRVGVTSWHPLPE